jgi:hypothetical protein
LLSSGFLGRLKYSRESDEGRFLGEDVMKQQVVRVAGTLLALLVAAAAMAGTWSANKFVYQPALEARGVAEKNNFDTGMSRVDNHLGASKILGDPDYETLAAALTTIGTGTNVTLTIPAKAVAVSANTTIPANIRLVVDRGANFQIATGVTLTIAGTISAGHYPIFTCTGTGKVDLSASPTPDFCLEWWGAQNGVSYDCAPALRAAVAAAGPYHYRNIKLRQGLWRIATPVAIDHMWGIGILGDGVDNTGLYIDVGAANDGITFGNLTAGQTNVQVTIKDLSVVGPANCCKNGLRFVRTHEMRLDNINLYMGCTQYGMSVEGCLWGDMNVYIGHNYGTPLFECAARVTDGIHITTAADAYANNVIRLRVKGTLMRNGVVLTNTLDPTGTEIGSPIIISGSLEACSGYPIYAENWNFGELREFYMTDLNPNYGFYLKRCKNIKITSLDAGNDSGTVCALENCTNVSIDNSRATCLNIDAACRGTVLKNLEIVQALNDRAPDTTSSGWMKFRSAPYAPLVNKTSDRVNLMPTLFARFRTDRPEGWDANNNTWTKCGTGLADTTAHLAPYSAKMVSSNGTGISNYPLSQDQLKQVAGRVINFSIWGKVATGQSLSNYPAVYLNLSVPSWQASHDYKVGEGVDVGGWLYQCTTAGASGGSAPTWVQTYGATITDGTVVWTAMGYDFATSSSVPFTSSDMGTWKKTVAGCYVPANATGLSVTLYVWRQTNNAETTMHWAEPCLMVGNQGPDGLVLSKEEVTACAAIGNNRIDFGAAAPSAGYCQQGDVRFNTNAAAGGAPGWVCVTSGVPGTWKAMGNVAN